MKNIIKGIVIGIIVCMLSFSFVYATGGIGSATFNTNNVNFNGKVLDLSSAPMISVVMEGETNFSNYMPVRAILEQMGYLIDWDDSTSTVMVKNKPAPNAEEGKKLIEESNLKERLADVDPDALEHFSEIIRAIHEDFGVDVVTLCLLMIEDFKGYLEGDDTLYGTLFN